MQIATHNVKETPVSGQRLAEGRALVRAQLYHFLELALAHPGEDGFAYLCAAETEAVLLAKLVTLPEDDRLASARTALQTFLGLLRRSDFDATEAAHIALFSANFPVVPCPPYGSLFTVEEPKRLEEMLAIKRFYHESGVDLASAFDDLPDHLCVELEFMHLLGFREDEADDPALVAALRKRQAHFIDRFLQPFVDRLATLALRFDSQNPYAQLVEATRLLLAHHRAEFGPGAGPSAGQKGPAS